MNRNKQRYINPSIELRTDALPLERLDQTPKGAQRSSAADLTTPGFERHWVRAAVL
jgi:hypothetical protein